MPRGSRLSYRYLARALEKCWQFDKNCYVHTQRSDLSVVRERGKAGLDTGSL